MQGSPVIRVVVLIVSLAIMGGVISSLTGKNPAAPIETAAPADDAPVKATLGIQLSAPARSLRLTSLDGSTVLLDLPNPGLESEHTLTVARRSGVFTALLSLEWTDPSQPNFLRLILEPESLDSSEVLLHAPDHLENHAVEFTWTED